MKTKIIIFAAWLFSVLSSAHAVNFDKNYNVSDSLHRLESDLTLSSALQITDSFGSFFISSGHSLLLTGSLRVDRPIFTAGDFTINGQGNSVELVPGGCFRPYWIENMTSSTLRLKNMNLVINCDYFHDGVARTTLELENVNLFLAANMSMDRVRILIKGLVSVYGWDKELILSKLQFPSGVQAGSSLYVGPGVTLSTRNFTVKNAFDCLDKSATIWFDGSTVRPYSGRGLGWRLSRGNVFFGGAVQIQNVNIDSYEENHDSAHSFELGNDGVHEVNSTVLPGAQVLVNGYLYHNPL
jgi:hypothetical protein